MTSVKKILMAIGGGAALAAAVAGGVALERYHLDGRAVETTANASTAAAGERQIAYWVAPMDPNFRRDAPGKSPMGMDLIPVYEDDGDAAEAEAGVVNLSGAVMQNLGVRTAEVVRADLTPEIRTFGTVAFDETRTSHVHVRAEGWIEKLHVRAVGEPVRAGEPLLEIFSPELSVAAWELAREARRGGSDLIPVAGRKLRALGADPRQIEEIARTGELPDAIKLYAPRSGVVVTLDAADGMYLEPDMTVASITDPTVVWLVADVLERHAAFVAEGMEAEARIAGLPDRVWRGAVEYVYADLRPETRTVRLRLRFANPDLLLKPNMYASVTLFAPPKKNVVAVPESALIRTGHAERVVLALGDGRFRSVPVKSGVTVGDSVEILEGVTPGDSVVVSAQFLIDSESSLAAGFRRMEEMAPPAPAEAEAWARATINKAMDAGVNVTHEPIPELGWPAMTMDLGVDAGVERDLMTPGQSVRIGLAKGGDGLYRIVDAEPAADPAAAPAPGGRP